MYHRILPWEQADAISIEQFNRQLNYLKKNFEFLSPEKVIDFINGDLEKSRRKYFALSFDDGWLDNWLYATEVLQKHDLRAILAQSTSNLHDAPLRNSEAEKLLRLDMTDAQKLAAQGDFRLYLNNSELAAMHNSGVWRIEAHGTLHQQDERGVSKLAAAAVGQNKDDFQQFLRNDIVNCCTKIKEITSKTPKMFFWPWGQYSQVALEVVKDLSLLQFTVSKGAIKYSAKRLVLPRIGVSPRWTKFRKNCKVFSSSFLTSIHSCFNTIKVNCDEFM